MADHHALEDIPRRIVVSHEEFERINAELDREPEPNAALLALVERWRQRHG